MKKKLMMMMMAVLACLTASAQSDFQKAVAKYKNSTGVTATATCVKHNSAVKKAGTYKGNLYMKKPNKVSIIVDGGKDKLIMNGTTFTMVKGGKKHVTDSKKNAQFATFQTVFQSILSGGATDITKLAGVNVAKSGQNLTITITPDSKKKMIFSSFVLVLDTKTSEIKSLRMKERGKNYTEYLFSNFSFNGKVNDTVFVP